MWFVCETYAQAQLIILSKSKKTMGLQPGLNHILLGWIFFLFYFQPDLVPVPG